MRLEPLEYSTFAKACEPDPKDVGIRLISSSPMKLYIPDIVSDANIRYMVERGKSLAEAYEATNIKSYLPTSDIRPCISEVFRTPQSTSFNPRQISGSTCVGFNQCMQEWIMANQPDPAPDPANRRMVIGKFDGGLVYTPSPNESNCVKTKFNMTRDMRTAYTECNCSEIIPQWPGGIEMLSALYKSQPDYSMYRLTKDAMNIMVIQSYTPPITITPTVSPSPVISPMPEITTPLPSQKPSINPLFILILGGLFLITLKSD